MRVLAFLADCPDPPISGSKVRNHHLWRELGHEGVEVRLLGTHFDPRRGDRFEAGGAEYFHPDRKPLPKKLAEIALRSYHERFVSSALLTRARELVHDWKPDVVHGEELRMGRYLLELGPGPYRRTMTLHNVESDLIARTGSFPYRSGASLADPVHRASLRRFERAAIEACDLAFAYSEADLARYRVLYPGARLQASRNGVAARAISPAAEPSEPRVLILGSLGYEPNVRGLFWFLDEILPKLPRGIAVTVAGSSATDRVRARLASEPRVEFADTPGELAPIYARASVCAVPLLDGGGTRTKILEALAHGRFVVSTPIGIEGLELRDGVALAADSSAFAEALAQFAPPSEAKSRAAASGRDEVLAKYDWSLAARELKQAWSKLIGA